MNGAFQDMVGSSGRACSKALRSAEPADNGEFVGNAEVRVFPF